MLLVILKKKRQIMGKMKLIEIHTRAVVPHHSHYAFCLAFCRKWYRHKHFYLYIYIINLCIGIYTYSSNFYNVSIRWYLLCGLKMFMVKTNQTDFIFIVYKVLLLHVLLRLSFILYIHIHNKCHFVCTTSFCGKFYIHILQLIFCSVL